VFVAAFLLVRHAVAGNGSPAPGVASGTTSSLALLATTDLHSNVLSYDYLTLAADDSQGFERVASLIRMARQEFPNALLLDNGDTIQGSVLADYQAQVEPIACDRELAMYKAMDAVGYDAGNIGNHDFNYGLSYLNQVTGSAFDVEGLPEPSAQTRCAGPRFPLVLANVYSAKSGKPLFQPYAILTKDMRATGPDGNALTVAIKVGIIGLAPPAIVKWDRRWLDGKVYSVGIKEAAEQFIPEMRAKGADLIVVLSHGGLDSSAYSPTMENAGYHLSRVTGVDALLLGHSHQVFPLDKLTTALASQFTLPGVDATKGTVNGIPTVMANHSGRDLGVIALFLSHDGSKWTVDRSKTRVENRAIKSRDGSSVAAAPGIADAIATEHQATMAYVRTPIGKTEFDISTHFADVGDPAAIELVNQAQADYVARYVQANLPQYAALPVLSISASFRSGFGGGNDYTDVRAGDIAMNHAADLYVYPNTVCAVKVSGGEIKAWLETAAKRFNRISLTKTTAQGLISKFPAYHFDMFTSKDISYEIDVTRPVNSRIRKLEYKGGAIGKDRQFIVATNSYRANGGGSFPGLDGSKTIYTSSDTVRNVLVEYIKATRLLTRGSNGSDRSWRFAKVATAGTVTFASAKDKLTLAQAAGLTNISLLRDDDGSGRGMSVYAIDLSK